MSDRVFGSEYMHWAKTQRSSEFNLALSGLGNLKLKDLDVDFDQLEITTETGYGYPPLVETLAVRLKVPSTSLVTAAGTTFANHLAMAALINPGDEVLMEQPTYEPLLALARYLGAEVKRFPRRFEDEFQIDLQALRKMASHKTRLIVITNLHNPSGVLTTEGTLREVGELARTVNARVLVDEVYLETMFDQRPPTAFQFGPEFVTTSSLTKAFGLSGLRCGWIVAEEALAERMWRLNDLFASTPVHASERLSVMALAQIDRITSKAKALLETNRKLVNDFLDGRDELDAVRTEYGTIVFPRLNSGNADEFVSLLKAKYETSVVPGRFFEEPQHFRMGYCCETEALAGGLERLDAALRE
jgi:aspartate/methionine/tyrosine aminotransferase